MNTQDTLLLILVMQGTSHIRRSLLDMCNAEYVHTSEDVVPFTHRHCRANDDSVDAHKIKLLAHYE